MLITKQVEVKINARNHKHYLELGYEVKNNAIIVVSVHELTKGSGVTIELECDYCNRPHEKRYADYIKRKETQLNKKDACGDCKSLKTKESNMLIHGVESTFSLKKVRDKRDRTMLDKYGHTHPMNDSETKEKVKATNMERYGVENAFQSKDIQNKQKETVREIYGVDNVFSNEGIKRKIKKTMLRKYGVTNPMQHPTIAKKSRINSHKAMAKNGTQSASSQQRYIHDLVGGELNHSFELLWLDIAYPEDKIYIEYDGSGHDIDVKYKKISEKAFQIKEIRRYKLLKSKGWKQIQIISRYDKLPCDSILVAMKDFGFDVLTSTENNWIKFDIDNKTISYDKNVVEFDFLNDDNNIL